MKEHIVDLVIQYVPQVASQYNRLILVVTPPGGGKTTILLDIGKRLNAPIININLEISRRLLELTERQRLIDLQSILGEIVRAFSEDVILLDNIEILFDESLKKDPLKLLQELSRNKTIVAAWNGTIINGQLTYAVSGHPEFRRYPIGDLIVINQEATV